MGLLDLFTGAASEKAAKNNQYAIGVGQQQAGNALQDSAKASLSYLFGAGANQPGALQLLGQGYDQGKSDLTNQYGDTQNYLGQATSAYQPLVNAGQGSLDSYYDAIGANGADGSARAAAAFQASPGYNYSMDQALGAVQRSAAARGGLAGGNATADILKTATGLADQGYNNYINNLKGGVGTYTTGVQGLANGLTTQGGASQSYGNALSTLDTGQGNGLAGIYGQGANIQTGLGNSMSSMIQNSTNALVGNNNNLAASENAAGANILGAILGGGQILAGGAGKAAGSGGGSNSLLGSLGSLFKFG